jgi:hypothetical protein
MIQVYIPQTWDKENTEYSRADGATVSHAVNQNEIKQLTGQEAEEVKAFLSHVSNLIDNRRFL